MDSPEPPHRVTVVVVAWRAAEPLRACLASLRAQSVDHSVVVVDNDADPATRAVIAAHPDVQVIENTENTGFAGGADQGLRAATTEFVAFLNDDARAEPDWLARLLDTADADPRVAAVTSLLLLDPAGSSAAENMVNNAGVVLLPTWYGADRAAGAPRHEVAAAADVFGFSGGAALLRRRPALDVGGFPTDFFLYYEDTDLSWRLQLAGWRVRYEPAAVVHHLHATSSDVRSTSFAFHNERNRLLMLVRCAPASTAAAAAVRFLVTTGSLLLRHGLHRGGPPNQRVLLRVRVLASLCHRLPALLVQRRRVRALRLTEADPTLGR